MKRKRRNVLQKGPRHKAIDELSLLSRYELIVYFIIFVIFLGLLISINRTPVRKIEIDLQADSLVYPFLKNQVLMDILFPVSSVRDINTFVDTASFLCPYEDSLSVVYQNHRRGSIITRISNVGIGSINSTISLVSPFHLHRVRVKDNSNLPNTMIEKRKNRHSVTNSFSFWDGLYTHSYCVSIKSWPFSSALSKPTMFDLYDISQSYYFISIKSLAIDSLALKLHYKGAVDINPIIGTPSLASSNSCSYQFKPLDKENMILLHVKHKDLENSQQIRMFGATSVLAALITLFLAFLIIFVYRLRHKELDE